MATALSTPRSLLLGLIPGRLLVQESAQRLVARLDRQAAANVALIDSRLEADRLAALRELRASRRRTVLAVEQERRRIERDLHDGAQQRLIALRIRLGLAAEIVTREPGASRHMLFELAEEAQGALDELRNLVHGIHPPLLVNRGLVAALDSVAREAPLAAHLDAADIDRCAPDVEAAVYFTCVEALQNAIKHAGPGARVTIHLREHPESLYFEVSDTGRGFDASAWRAAGGLVNMRDRIGAAGGELEIRSAAGRGTSIAGSVPAMRRTSA
jgi:signal transduction histidine kinase